MEREPIETNNTFQLSVVISACSGEGSLSVLLQWIQASLKRRITIKLGAIELLADIPHTRR